MKKIIIATLAATTLFGSGAAACMEEYSAPLEELEQNGVDLRYYTITFTGAYYRALSSDGSVLRLKLSHSPDALKPGDRVRVFVSDGEVLSAEKVIPSKVQYKVTSVLNGAWTASSVKYGKIEFSEAHLEGAYPRKNEYVVAEFDDMYIEGGLIKVYKGWVK